MDKTYFVVIDMETGELLTENTRSYKNKSNKVSLFVDKETARRSLSQRSDGILTKMIPNPGYNPDAEKPEKYSYDAYRAWHLSLHKTILVPNPNVEIKEVRLVFV